jgi:hypothetical protein
MRFAIMHGLLRADSEQQRQAALAEGAAAAARTAVWLGQHPFATPEDLERYGHLVSWQGTDASGRPVLRISLGQAVTECRGATALAFANATVTHMEMGVAERLHDWSPSQQGSDSCSGSRAMPSLARPDSTSSAAPAASPGSSSAPEQLVVVMDCSGASSLNAARVSWVCKAVASTLNHHYPGRCASAGKAGAPAGM